ncbi:hypothetical protein BX666DRAFT_1969933 [Dichotomocladium elegans]|nr:hypothetical protein BX666DRAFT_1969933 [Dichotomocladium elegans]
MSSSQENTTSQAAQVEDANAKTTTTGADSSTYYADPNQYYYSGYDYSSYGYDQSYYDPSYYTQYYDTAAVSGSSITPAIPLNSVAPLDVASQQSTYNPAPPSSHLNKQPVGSFSMSGYSGSSTAGARSRGYGQGASGPPGTMGGMPVVTTSGLTAAEVAGLPEDPTAVKKNKKKPKARMAGGEIWEDPSLQDWDENDYRLFAGDLGNEVTEELLFKAFAKYTSLQRTRVVRDKRTGKTRGYGFLSFKDPNDFVKAWREMNGKYVGNRPIKLRKSSWKDRNLDVRARKERERLGPYPKIK